jgi:hypothetical protein
MAKNFQKYTISQVYDIAKTIISDPTFKASKDTCTTYKFKKEGLYMDIHAPHGSKEWDGDYDTWDYNTGSITITDENGSMHAQTKHNVGRAKNRSSINPIAIFTRLRAPLFFRLIDMAEKRGLDQTDAIKLKIGLLRGNTR